MKKLCTGLLVDFDWALERLVEVYKGSQICMIIGMEGNKNHLKRKAEEGGTKEEVTAEVVAWQAGGAHHILRRGDYLNRQLPW